MLLQAQRQLATMHLAHLGFLFGAHPVPSFDTPFLCMHPALLTRFDPSKDEVSRDDVSGVRATVLPHACENHVAPQVVQLHLLAASGRL